MRETMIDDNEYLTRIGVYSEHGDDSIEPEPIQSMTNVTYDPESIDVRVDDTSRYTITLDRYVVDDGSTRTTQTIYNLLDEDSLDRCPCFIGEFNDVVHELCKILTLNGSVENAILVFNHLHNYMINHRIAFDQDTSMQVLNDDIEVKTIQ